MNLTNAILNIWLIGTILISFQKALGYTEVPDEKKCHYLRTNRMLKGRCYDMNLKEIPQYLTTSIEVLDVSYNRIKKLRKSSFQRYRSVKYLLLYENMIQSIEPDTFSNLNSLEEIDLSNNGLTTIPLEIFQLPSLRNLYVDSNELINFEQDLQKLEKPIRAPLGYLNIADCGLQDIPNLGILPYLWQLNASVNPLNNVAVEKLMPMCHLKTVDFNKTNMPICACHTIKTYLEIRGLSNSVHCDTIEDDACPEIENISLVSNEFDACNAVILNDKAKLTWMTVAGSLVGFLVLFICILFYFHKRNVRKARKLQIKQNKKTKLQEENGNEELLKSSA